MRETLRCEDCGLDRNLDQGVCSCGSIKCFGVVNAAGMNSEQLLDSFMKIELIGPRVEIVNDLSGDIFDLVKDIRGLPVVIFGAKIQSTGSIYVWDEKSLEKNIHHRFGWFLCDLVKIRKQEKAQREEDIKIFSRMSTPEGCVWVCDEVQLL
jgi:hypothetical protein